MEHKEFDSIAVLAIDMPGFDRVDAAGEAVNDFALQKQSVQSSASSCGGALVKTIGNSFILSFPDAYAALKCGFGLIGQDTNPGRKDLFRQARMGIHIGKASQLGFDLLGEAVDGAQSLKAVSQPGTICVSSQIIALTLGSQRFSAVPLNEHRQRTLPQDLAGYTVNTVPSAAESSAETIHDEAARPGHSMDDIRAAILEDIRRSGRRMTVREARKNYGWYGVEATEVIAALAESGILVMEAREPAPPASPGELGRSIETAIHAIVSEIERSVQSSIQDSRKHGSSKGRHHGSSVSASFSGSMDSDAGTEARIRVKTSKRASRKESRTSSPRNSFAKYSAEIQKKAEKSGKGIVGSIVSFALINPLLWYLNINQSPGFPWAPLVSVFWGSGVVGSILTAIRSRRHARETSVLPDLDDEQTRELKALHSAGDSIAGHFMSTITIPSALMLINIGTRSGEPWFVIPSAILGVTFVIHLIQYLASIPGRRRKFFAAIGMSGSKKGIAEAKRRQDSMPQDLGAYTDLYRDASDTAFDIERDLAEDDSASAEEMKPSLDAYLGQVHLLAKTANELDSIIGEIPMEALKKDKVALNAKLATAPPSMKMEYECSISEIEKQEESFNALREQREVIDLRLKSSVHQLNQLKMDLARARAADMESDANRSESALSSIRARSLELSRYIDDLRSGQLEALADPFAELEKKYGAPKSLEDTQGN